MHFTADFPRPKTVFKLIFPQEHKSSPVEGKSFLRSFDLGKTRQETVVIEEVKHNRRDRSNTYNHGRIDPGCRKQGALSAHLPVAAHRDHHKDHGH